MQELLTSSSFRLSEIQALSVQFERRQGDSNDSLNRAEFKRFLTPLGIDVSSEAAAARYFDAFDTDKNGEISFKELVCGLSLALKGTADEKALLQFSAFDTDHDGALSKPEFMELIRAVSPPGSSVAEAMADHMFDVLDTNRDGEISFPEFKKALVNSMGSLTRTLQLKDFENQEGCWGVTHLSEDERSVVELLGTRLLLGKGDTLAHSEQSRAIYILERGALDVSFLGKPLLSVTAKEEEPFLGEVSLFSHLRSLYGEVKAAQDTSLLAIRVSDILPLVLHDHPGTCKLMERLGGLMFNRLKNIETQIQERLHGGEADPADCEALTSYLTDIQKLLATWALAYHTVGHNGKLEVVPSKKVGTAADLSVAYSPGVAEPCIAIKHNPELAYDYTSKGHLVGVVSNGTAVLGLGNIGALASKPVMEGKAVLFKQFGGLGALSLSLTLSLSLSLTLTHSPRPSPLFLQSSSLPPCLPQTPSDNAQKQGCNHITCRCKAKVRWLPSSPMALYQPSGGR